MKNDEEPAAERQAVADRQAVASGMERGGEAVACSRLEEPMESMEPIVVTVFNQKGGIGKTTTSVNLATCLAAGGWRVALIDIDSQSNATTSLGLVAMTAPGAYELFKGSVTVAQTLLPTRFPGLSVCRAADELAGIAIDLALQADPHALLRRRLAAGGVAADIVIIDCPPALGPLPINALVASHLVLVPVTPEPMARDGLHRAWRHIQRIRSKINPRLEMAGIVLTMARDDIIHTALVATLHAELGSSMMAIEIPFDPQVPAASQHDIPVCVYDPYCSATRAYLALTEALARTVRRVAGVGAIGNVATGFDVLKARATLQEWNLAMSPPLRFLADAPASPSGWLSDLGDELAQVSPPVPERRSPAAGSAAVLGFGVGGMIGIGLAALGRQLGWLP
ncbi:MAG: ParA family protein [Rhodospirillaceae bacterium]